VPERLRALDWLARRHAGESAALIAHHAGVSEAVVLTATKAYGPFPRPTQRLGARSLPSEAQVDERVRRWIEGLAGLVVQGCVAGVLEHGLDAFECTGTGLVGLAPAAPYPAEGLEWMAGMHDGNVEGFSAAIEGEAALRPLLERDLPGMLAGSADDLAKLMADGVADMDRAHVTGDLVEDLLASNHVGLGGGVDGWCDDALALMSSWGFDLQEISIPTMLWQGGADVSVPFGHGTWLAERIPGVRSHLLEDDGHFSIVAGRMGEILDELMSAT